MTTNETTLSAPLGMLAELTHRCPLGCPYCSNPLELDKRGDELDTATWARVFSEAAGLGVLQVHLSGGEPAARRDLPEIVAAAREAGLYNNLITSAVGLTPRVSTTYRSPSRTAMKHPPITSPATKAPPRASGQPPKRS